MYGLYFWIDFKFLNFFNLDYISYLNIAFIGYVLRFVLSFKASSLVKLGRLESYLHNHGS